MLASVLCASYLDIVIQFLLKQHKVHGVIGSILYFDSFGLCLFLSFLSSAIDHYFILHQHVTETLLIHQA